MPCCQMVVLRQGRFRMVSLQPCNHMSSNVSRGQLRKTMSYHSPDHGATEYGPSPYTKHDNSTSE
eukprot:3646078-Amphidinium_carterae.1